MTHDATAQAMLPQLMTYRERALRAVDEEICRTMRAHAALYPARLTTLPVATWPPRPPSYRNRGRRR